MAHILLVEFDNPEQAQEMIKRFHKASRAGKPFRLLGVFKTPEPEDMCKCAITSDTQRKNEVARGAKYGWYIHKPCGKPRGPINPLNILPRMLGKVTTRNSWLEQLKAGDASLHTNGEGRPIPNFPLSVKRKTER